MAAPHSLTPYGWNDRVAAAFAGPAGDQQEVPGRVVRADRGLVLVATAGGQVRADPHSLRSRRLGVDAAPVAGDWVSVEDDPASGWIVARVVPRWSQIVRIRPDDRSDEGQLLAANVDLVGVVVPLDRPLGANRIERTLAVAWESGALPIVVLTKSDSRPDAAAAVAEVEAVAGRAEVIATSTVDGAGIDRLRELVRQAGTLVLLGPSGAGKSTLVNALAGHDGQATGAVRENDRRGRHTTTARHLVPLPGGGVLLDTPGIRSLGLLDVDEGMTQSFDDIESLAQQCRFRDCQHGQEPGCAVIAAVNAGELDGRRVASYQKLREELAAADQRATEAARRGGRRRR